MSYTNDESYSVPVPSQILKIVGKKSIDFLDQDWGIASSSTVNNVNTIVKLECVRKRNSVKTGGATSENSEDTQQSETSSQQSQRTTTDFNTVRNCLAKLRPSFQSFLRDDWEMPPKKSPRRATSPSDIFNSPRKPVSKSTVVTATTVESPAKLSERVLKDPSNNGRTKKEVIRSPVRRSARLMRNPEVAGLDKGMDKKKVVLTTRGKKTKVPSEAKGENQVQVAEQTPSVEAAQVKLPKKRLFSDEIGSKDAELPNPNSRTELNDESMADGSTNTSQRSEKGSKSESSADDIHHRKTLEKNLEQVAMDLTLESGNSPQLRNKREKSRSSPQKKVVRECDTATSDECSSNDKARLNSNRSSATKAEKQRDDSTNEEDGDDCEIIPATQFVTEKSHSRSSMSDTYKSDKSPVLKLHISSTSVDSTNGGSIGKSELLDKSRSRQLKITDFVGNKTRLLSKTQMKEDSNDASSSVEDVLESNQVQRNSNSNRQRVSTPGQSPRENTRKDPIEIYSVDIFDTEQAQSKPQLTPSKKLPSRKSAHSLSNEKTKLDNDRRKSRASLGTPSKTMPNDRGKQSAARSSASSEKGNVPDDKTKTTESQLSHPELLVNTTRRRDSEESTDSSSGKRDKLSAMSSKNCLTPSKTSVSVNVNNNSEESDSSSEEEAQSLPVMNEIGVNQLSQPEILVNKRVIQESEESTDSSDEQDKIPAPNSRLTKSMNQLTSEMVNKNVDKDSEESDSSSEDEAKTSAFATNVNDRQSSQPLSVKKRVRQDSEESTDSSSDEQDKIPAPNSRPTKSINQLTSSEMVNKNVDKDSEESDSSSEDEAKTSAFTTNANDRQPSQPVLVKKRARQDSEESTDSSSDEQDKIPPTNANDTRNQLTPLKMVIHQKVEQDSEESDSSSDEEINNSVVRMTSGDTQLSQSGMLINKRAIQDSEESTDSSSDEQSNLPSTTAKNDDSKSTRDPSMMARQVDESPASKSIVNLSIDPRIHRGLKNETKEDNSDVDSEDSFDPMSVSTQKPKSVEALKDAKKRQPGSSASDSSDSYEGHLPSSLAKSCKDDARCGSELGEKENVNNLSLKERGNLLGDDSKDTHNLAPFKSKPESSAQLSPIKKQLLTDNSDSDDSRGKRDLTPFHRLSQERKPNVSILASDDSSDSELSENENPERNTSNPQSYVKKVEHEDTRRISESNNSDSKRPSFPAAAGKDAAKRAPDKNRETSDSESDSTDSEDEQRHEGSKIQLILQKGAPTKTRSESDTSGSGRLPAYSLPKVQLGSSRPGKNPPSSDESSSSDSEGSSPQLTKIKLKQDTLVAKTSNASSAELCTRGDAEKQSSGLNTVSRKRQLSDDGGHSPQAKFPRLSVQVQKGSSHQQSVSSSENSDECAEGSSNQLIPSSTTNLDKRKRKEDAVSSSDSSDEQEKPKSEKKKKKLSPPKGHPFDSTRLSEDVETFFPESDISVIQKESTIQKSPGQPRTLTGGVFAVPAPVHARPVAQRVQPVLDLNTFQNTCQVSSIGDFRNLGYTASTLQIDYDSDKGVFEEDFLDEDVEVYIVQCPKEVDPKSLLGQKIDLNLNESTINLTNKEGSPYLCDIYCDLSDSDVGVNLVTPCRQTKRLSFSYVPLAGRITVAEAVNIPNVPEFDRTTPPRVAFPDNLKPRNPFVESDELVLKRKKNTKREKNSAKTDIPKSPKSIETAIGKKKVQHEIEPQLEQVEYSDHQKKKKNKSKKYEFQETLASEAESGEERIKLKKEAEVELEPPITDLGNHQISPDWNLSLTGKKEKKKKRNEKELEDATVTVQGTSSVGSSETYSMVDGSAKKKKKKAKKEEEIELPSEKVHNQNQLISADDAHHQPHKKKKKKEKARD